VSGILGFHFVREECSEFKLSVYEMCRGATADEILTLKIKILSKYTPVDSTISRQQYQQTALSADSSISTDRRTSDFT
jgi:hypothetical protein